jgi:hypothetical protein
MTKTPSWAAGPEWDERCKALDQLIVGQIQQQPCRIRDLECGAAGAEAAKVGLTFGRTARQVLNTRSQKLRRMGRIEPRAGDVWAIASKPRKDHFTPAEIAELFSYDPVTGIVRWVKPTSTRISAGAICGQKARDGKLIVVTGGKLLRVHRVAWCLHFGRWPEQVIDHINGDPSDNRIVNLRDVSVEVNNENKRRALRTSMTGLLGVSACGKRYTAAIQKDKKRYHLGCFDTPEEAHAAYVTAKRRLHHKGCTL